MTIEAHDIPYILANRFSVNLIRVVFRYGLEWGDGSNLLRIEMFFIQGGGYLTKDGKRYGQGLFHHYKALQQLLWPEGEDHHRWSDLMLETILENRITAITGARDSGKTHVALSRFGLTDYFCFPDETLILVSSTDLRGLKLRVWGDMSDLFRKAKNLHPWLPGNVVESLHGIFTDKLGDDTPVRDLRRGLICIPCLDRKGTWVGGLEKFVGIKQKRRRVLGDEVQFMHAEYLTIMSNLDEGDFKGVFVGNTLPNRKALDKIAEPVEGWENRPQATKTDVFKNRFDGVTIQLVGTDSPNFDDPPDAPVRYKYMVNRNSEKRVGDRWGRDSAEYHSQISGLRKTGLFINRVLSEDICRRGLAFEHVTWSGDPPPVKVYACDMAFGGDRAIAGFCEFGKDVEGRTILRVNPPHEIQLSVETDAEDQISLHIRKDCMDQDIPASHVYFDAGMRATAATSLAKLFSPDVNAVNFGGTPTKRPVCADEYVLDSQTMSKRLKRCDEQYDRFVTELWFSVRYAVLSKQVRELPNDVAEEFYEREWTLAKGGRYELETKDEMKLRCGYSPDLADWLGIAVEGARRLGFMVEALPEFQGQNKENEEYLKIELTKYRQSLKKRSLSYK